MNAVPHPMCTHMPIINLKNMPCSEIHIQNSRVYDIVQISKCILNTYPIYLAYAPADNQDIPNQTLSWHLRIKHLSPQGKPGMSHGLMTTPAIMLLQLNTVVCPLAGVRGLFSIRMAMSEA